MIIQINIWCCSSCNVKMTTLEDTSPYSDPTVLAPGGNEWGYVGEGGLDGLVCPSCLTKQKERDEVTEKTKQAQKLAQIIENNRGRCTAEICYDAWYIYKDQPAGFENLSVEEQDDWHDNGVTLARWNDYLLLGNSYGSGILEALALRAGLKVENV